MSGNAGSIAVPEALPFDPRQCCIRTTWLNVLTLHDPGPVSIPMDKPSWGKCLKPPQDLYCTRQGHTRNSPECSARWSDTTSIRLHIWVPGWRENQALGGKRPEVTLARPTLYGLITLSRVSPVRRCACARHVGPIWTKDQGKRFSHPRLFALSPGHHLRPKGCILPSTYTLWRTSRAFPPSQSK